MTLTTYLKTTAIGVTSFALFAYVADKSYDGEVSKILGQPLTKSSPKKSIDSIAQNTAQSPSTKAQLDAASVKREIGYGVAGWFSLMLTVGYLGTRESGKSDRELNLFPK